MRDAESRSCAGLAADDRGTSPFQRREDIVAVVPLRLNQFDGRGKLGPEKPVGVVVTFWAVPGMSVEWLQRIIECHLARNAALGHAVPEMPNCPLVPGGVEARVSSAGNGFAVSISSRNATIAREILSRAERLMTMGAENSFRE